MAPDLPACVQPFDWHKAMTNCIRPESGLRSDSFPIRTLRYRVVLYEVVSCTCLYLGATSSLEQDHKSEISQAKQQEPAELARQKKKRKEKRAHAFPLSVLALCRMSFSHCKRCPQPLNSSTIALLSPSTETLHLETGRKKKTCIQTIRY